jgi:hypothetical protein
MNVANDNPWHERFVRSGYFFGAVLLHLIAFLLVATLVIWNAPAPPDSSFKGVKILPPTPPPPPPPEPSSSGGAAQNPQFEPQPVVVPVVTPPSVTTTSFPSSFTVDSAKLDAAVAHLNSTSPQGTGLSQGANDSGQGSGNGFGSSTGTDNQLVGYLYDLKQTSDRKPTGMTPELYHQILMRFVRASWDESILAPYYKSSKPLYTSEIIVPNMDSQEGPKAFGLDGEVQPKMWIIWYKGKVAAPASADYRFAGFCDDILLVRIGGKTVLDGSINPVATQLDVVTPWPNKWVPPIPEVPNYGQLREGLVTSFTQGDPVDMDVIIGEEPGGQFNASLFVLRTDKTYPTTTDGVPILPLFQLGQGASPPGGVHPPINETPEPW